MDHISDLVFLAIPLVGLIVHSGIRLRRFDHQCANTDAQVSHAVLIVTTSKLCSNLIYTGMDRSLRAGIRHTVGLHTCIEDIYAAVFHRQVQDSAIHKGHSNGIHSVGLVVEFEVTAIIDIAIFIHKVHIGIVGHDDDFTRNRLCVVRIVA